MRNLKTLHNAFLLILILCHSVEVDAQIVLDADSAGKITVAQEPFHSSDQLKIGGYIQPQFQAAQNDGINSFAGGNFPSDVNNRFMLRRGRIRFDYSHYSKKNKKELEFVFQFDGSERGVFIRDFWGKLFDNRFDLFNFTFGMFPRPFGYELTLSSSERESPERGRMSQILMKTERDLGAMISLDNRRKNSQFKNIKLDVGVFNGPGLTAVTDIDSRKDVITKLSLKPTAISKKITIAAALSGFQGSIIQNTQYVFKTDESAKKMIVDSAGANKGKYAPRKYYGADLQLKRKIKAGYAEFRIEYIFGKQTSTSVNSETPPAKLTGNEGYYIRNFNGIYVCYLQHIFNVKNQLILKYDWYDPNSDVQKQQLNVPAGFTGTDIKYSTIGAGLCHYFNEHFKTTVWYDKVMNEKTLLPEFISDVKDDVVTLRMQFTF